MITLFENFLDKTIKEFASLFFRKICEYGDVVCKDYVYLGNYEIEFIENKELYIFAIILIDEGLDGITITIKSSLLNNSLFYKTLLEYLDNSEFFKLINRSKNKYIILGTPEEVEEDLKNLEIMTHANNYNL